MQDDSKNFFKALRFLNEAQSPEELAKVLQGEATAARKTADILLAQKKAVGGMFVSHEQVASLSQVGAEGLALIQTAVDKTADKPPKIEKERAQFLSLLLENPNYFGNLEGSPFKAVKAVQSNKQYEELACLGLDSPYDRLEAVIRIKQNSGYSGDICTAGSTEFVRFYVDLQNNGVFHDVGMTSVQIHDIPGPKPLCYAVRHDFSSIRKFCFFENIVKVRAILSWNVPPPPNNPNFNPVWGDRVDAKVQIQPSYFIPFGDLVKEIDLAKVKIPDPIGPVIHTLNPATQLQALTPEVLSVPQKRALYTKQDVPVHRFAFHETQAALNTQVAAAQVFLPGKKSVLEEIGLKAEEIGGILGKLQLITDGDTSFEQLRCVGLRPSSDLLEGVLTVKKPNGFSGPLCSAGSTEYVAFWMDFNDGSGFNYMGTATVPVHDLTTVGPDGVQYAVFLKTNLNKWRVPCEVGARVARLRAILSWETPPPHNNPNYVPTWGNREECLVQLRPGLGTGHVPLIETVGDVPVNRIDQGTGLATGHMEIANTVVLNQAPFGGEITITGQIGAPPDVFGAGLLPFKYKVEVRREDGVDVFHPLMNSIDVSVAEWISGNPVMCSFLQFVCDQTLIPTPVDDGDGLGPGWYTYLESPTGVHTRHLVLDTLGRWETNSAMEGLWTIRITAKNPNTSPPTVFTGIQDIKVWIDNTRPVASIDITSATFNGNPIPAVDCGKFPVGTILTGTFSAHDPGSIPHDLDPAYQHFGSLSFEVIPAGPAGGAAVTTASPTSFPAVPTTGEDGTWMLDTHGMQACGYVIRFTVCDRTNYASRGNSLCATDDVGFCLE